MFSSHELLQKVRMRALHEAETVQPIAAITEMPRCEEGGKPFFPRQKMQRPLGSYECHHYQNRFDEALDPDFSGLTCLGSGCQIAIRSAIVFRLFSVRRSLSNSSRKCFQKQHFLNSSKCRFHYQLPLIRKPTAPTMYINMCMPTSLRTKLWNIALSAHVMLTATWYNCCSMVNSPFVLTVNSVRRCTSTIVIFMVSDSAGFMLKKQTNKKRVQTMAVLCPGC